jgi:hypothetical protein
VTAQSTPFLKKWDYQPMTPADDGEDDDE